MKKITVLSYIIALFALTQLMHGMDQFHKNLDPQTEQDIHSSVWGNLGVFAEQCTTVNTINNPGKVEFNKKEKMLKWSCSLCTHSASKSAEAMQNISNSLISQQNIKNINSLVYEILKHTFDHNKEKRIIPHKEYEIIFNALLAKLR